MNIEEANAERIQENFANSARPVVCIQGLGFVGIAMAIAVASAKDRSGVPVYNVIGVDLPNSAGQEKVRAINEGRLPVSTNDKCLETNFLAAIDRGNLVATTDSTIFRLAEIVVVDVHLDVDFETTDIPSVDFSGFRSAIRTIGTHLRPGRLVLIETTVPPGTCEKVVVPELDAALVTRGLPAGSLLVAHSYERVMPGSDYYDSIVNFWRVFAGTTSTAADRCRLFLSSVINVTDYPLRQLGSTTSTETAKVLENSYRAVNIALMQEWGRFAEEVGINLFEVIEAIRDRPTHQNIRQPGFGVGGYCLTKDPALGLIGAHQLLGKPKLDFPFCRMALETNQKMPLASTERLRLALGGTLFEKSVLLLGVSYRQDVGDTRNSPAEAFVRACEKEGAVVTVHDPLVGHWPELSRQVSQELPAADGYDGIVLAVQHSEYRSHDFMEWLGSTRATVLDANHVLSDEQILSLTNMGHAIVSIGRG